jgi:hypothetical protein
MISSKHYQKNTTNVIFLFVLILLLLLSFQVVALETNERQYNNYIIRLDKKSLEDGVTADKLIISQNGKLLFEEEGNITFREVLNLDEIGDLKKITFPTIVIDNYSGGAHCCFTTSIIDLADKLNISKFEGVNGYVELRPIANSNYFKVIIPDNAYIYQWTSFASSPFPEVIMYYDAKSNIYQPNISSMKKAELSREALRKKINHINAKTYKNFKYAYKEDLDLLTFNNRNANEEYFAKLLPIVLDLIYSGNMSQAMETTNKTWPSNKESKKLFISDLNKAIRKSPYADVILELNKPYFNNHK